MDDPRLRALLREIHARGHEIGIHPGYHTYRHPEALARFDCNCMHLGPVRIRTQPR
ncbi:MAG: hypothetical protein IT487_17040 [Chromatiaceae bacterium]|nr:hypothetical protein [Chromatiaceae bacterium]